MTHHGTRRHMRYRLIPAVSLMCLAAAGQDKPQVDDLAALVLGRLPEWFVESHEVEIPAARNLSPPELTIEYFTGGEMSTYHYVHVDAGGEKVLATHVVVRAVELAIPDPPGFESGCLVWHGVVGRELVRRLVNAIDRIDRTRSRPRQRGSVARSGGTRATNYGGIRIELPNTLTVEGCVAPSSTRDLVDYHGIDDVVRARLLYEVVRDSVTEMKLAPADDVATGAACAALLRDFPRKKSFPLRFRALALGFFGFAPAAAELRKIHASVPEVTLALDMLDTDALCRAADAVPPRLVALYASPNAFVANWATRLVARRFPAERARVVRAAYAGSPQITRLRLLQELQRVDPADKSLAEAALAEKDARVRCEAAYILDRSDVLLEIASSKLLVKPDDFDSRLLAIECLGWEERSDQTSADVGSALISILSDDADDVRCRKAAAEALGERMEVRAIGVLCTIMNAPPPRTARYLSKSGGGDGSCSLVDDIRLGAARALGMLRAREGVRPLVAYLSAEPRPYEDKLRWEVGFALARIADDVCLEELKAESVRREKRGEEGNDEALRLCESIRARDLAGILQLDRAPFRPAAELILKLFGESEVRAYLETSRPADADVAFLSRVLSMYPR